MKIEIKRKIYILHGWTYTTEKWEPFINYFEANGIEVSMINIPGLTAPLNSVWNLDNYIEWLRKVLEAEEGKVILLGHSNGGRISLGFTLKYPEKVKLLILIDSAGIYHNEFPLKVKRFIFNKFAKIGKKMKLYSFKKFLYKAAKEHDYEQAGPLVKETMRNLISVDLKNSLTEIMVRTLIIWGENDKVTPISDGKLLNEKIKDSKLFVIKNARHSPHVTDVENVGKIIMQEIDN